jgi:hypothetical protein
MKKLSILILSVVLVFGLTFTGCDIAKDLISKFIETSETPVAPDTPDPNAPAPTTPAPIIPAPVPGSTDGSFNQNGYLNGTGASYTFSLDAGTDDFVELPFVYPEGSVDFWVKVVGEDGVKVLGDFDLDNGEIIQLKGGRVFFLTIYSKAGAGAWSTSYTIGDTAPVAPASPTCNTSGNSAYGYLPVNGSCTFIVYSSTGYIEVPFTYPEGYGKFWVKVVDPDNGSVLGNFDLDNGEIIKLTGEGSFSLTITANSGSGNWSAAW